MAFLEIIKYSHKEPYFRSSFDVLHRYRMGLNNCFIFRNFILVIGKSFLGKHIFIYHSLKFI